VVVVMVMVVVVGGVFLGRILNLFFCFAKFGCLDGQSKMNKGVMR
jgi:hypothetical protein